VLVAGAHHSVAVSRLAGSYVRTCLNISWHGYVDCALFIVPVDGDVTVHFHHPVGGDRVFGFQGI
jgi:hypothetical protein